MRERVVRESSGSAQYPTLTRTNYADWAMVIRIQLQAQGLWEAVEYGNDDRDDRAALAALPWAVPPEMIRTLAGKDSAKEAWVAEGATHEQRSRTGGARTNSASGVRGTAVPRW